MARRRVKVVLYNPRAVFYTMPLALVAVGSHLDPAEVEVVIIDGRLERSPAQAILAHGDAVCLGVTVLTGAPLQDAIQVSRAVKAARPSLPIVWGGWHASMFGRECLREPAVDVTVQGQGEETFVEIVERVADGRDLGGCAGCIWRDADGAVHANRPRPLGGIDGFRAHNYDLIPVERYFTLKGRRQIDYISSQGCQFRCAFCADPFVYERQWVGLAPDRMADELAGLWQKHRFTDVNFQDETFFTRPARVEAIARGLIDRGVRTTWAGTMRADQGARLPEDSMALCRASGLRRALVGVESGSAETLKRIKKDIRLDQVFESADKMRRHGVGGHFPFIIGFPGESDESVEASLAVARRLGGMSPDFTTPIFYFKPYPGTSITDEAVRDGYRLPDTLDEWARFDYVGSVGGPWVSPERFERVERFKFYQRLGYGRARRWLAPLRRMARWRCERHEYRWPIEMRVGRWWRPAPELS
jgi:radical SAM superfamily enzyme YgiQ (UPF0313 family)